MDKLSREVAKEQNRKLAISQIRRSWRRYS
jgi:hypothetical protein